MKKMLFAALVIASMSFAACGKKNNAPAKPMPTAPTGDGSGSAAPPAGDGSGSGDAGGGAGSGG